MSFASIVIHLIHVIHVNHVTHTIAACLPWPFRMGRKMPDRPDKIDKQLIKCVDSLSGERVDKIIKHLDCRTAKTLRDRLDALDARGYVRLDRFSLRRQVRAYITPLGKEAISGWVEDPSAGEESS
jgi:hypothetical protein